MLWAVFIIFEDGFECSLINIEKWSWKQFNWMGTGFEKKFSFRLGVYFEGTVSENSWLTVIKINPEPQPGN